MHGDVQQSSCGILGYEIYPRNALLSSRSKGMEELVGFVHNTTMPRFAPLLLALPLAVSAADLGVPLSWRVGPTLLAFLHSHSDFLLHQIEILQLTVCNRTSKYSSSRKCTLLPLGQSVSDCIDNLETIGHWFARSFYLVD